MATKRTKVARMPKAHKEGHSLHHTKPTKVHSLRHHLGAGHSGSHNLRHHLAK